MTLYKRRKPLSRTLCSILGVKEFKASNVEHMHVNNAYMCEDCHHIGNHSRECPACTSKAVFGLAGILAPSAQTPKVSYARVSQRDMTMCV